MTTSISFSIKSLTADEIAKYMWANDGDLFQKLSERADIQEYANKLSESAVQFTLYDNAKLVGLSPCYFNDPEGKSGYISAFIILAGYRQQGLGKRLIEQIKLYGKEHSFAKLQVKVHCDNKVLKNCYESFGFAVSGEENDWSTLEYDLR